VLCSGPRGNPFFLCVYDAMLFLLVLAVTGPDSGSPICPCISPVDLGMIPLDGGYIKWGATAANKNIRIDASYGSNCDNPDYYTGYMPDGYPGGYCTGAANDPAYCQSSFCYVDLCSCGLFDATQTLVWASLYPTATRLAFSYDTCARCHERITEGQCILHHRCSWDTNTSKCTSLTTSDHMKTWCSLKNVNNCGGPFSYGCQWQGGECLPATFENLYQGWGCMKKPTGESNCPCINGGREYGNDCRAWDHIDTLGRDSTGNACVGSKCTDSWCFVDPCSCGAPDMFELFEVGSGGASLQGSGKMISKATCAQCSSRLTKIECEQQLSCEWKAEAYCQSKLYIESCSSADLCNNSACENLCMRSPWTRADETKWKCALLEVWPTATSPPSARFSPCSADTRSTIYYFGGATFDELWSFDIPLQRWTLIDAGGGPIGRTGCSLLADDDKNRLFLFAGKNGGTYLNDLWEYQIDTGSWTQLANAGMKMNGGTPDPRHRPAAILVPGKALWDIGKCVDSTGTDITTGQTFLGNTNGRNDCYALCVRVSNAAGCEYNNRACSYHSAAVSTGDGTAAIWCRVITRKIFVYGGHDAMKVFDDWWIYDRFTDAWSKNQGSGSLVEPRADANFVLLKHLPSPRLVLYGGTGYPITSVEYTNVFLIDLTDTDPEAYLRRTLITITNSTDPQCTGMPRGRYLAATPSMESLGTTVSGDSSFIVAGGYSSSEDVTFDDVWLLTITQKSSLNSAGNYRYSHDAEWKCVLPLDPAWPKNVGLAPEPDTGWSGREGAWIGDHLYLAAGWHEGGVPNALRRINLKKLGVGGEDTSSCAQQPVSKASRVKDCKYQMFPKDSFTMSTPIARFGHGQVVQAGAILIFGGENEDGKLNDLWGFNVNALVDKWDKLPSKPAARSHMNFVAVRDLVWMFGGYLGDGTPSAEVWIFDLINIQWEESQKGPVALARACAAVDENWDVWIYGGELDDGSTSKTLWKVEILLGRWTAMGEWEERLDCAMFVKNSYLHIVLGRKGSNTYDTSAWVKTELDIGETELKFTTTEWPLGKPAALPRAEMGYTQVNSSLYLIGGRVWNAFFIATEATFVKIDFEDDKVVNCELMPTCPTSGAFCWTVPPHNPGFVVAGATLGHRGNQLTVFGGEQQAKTSRDFLFLSWEDLPCSKGTQGPLCTPCGIGTYQLQNTTCAMCPLGTSSSIVGGFSPQVCRKCNEGTYADQMGLSECKPCPEGKKCEVGALKPEDISNQTDEGDLVVIFPEAFKRNENQVKDLRKILLYTGIGLVVGFLMLIVVIISWKGPKYATDKLGMVDVFRNVLKTRDGDPRPSIPGAFCTTVLIPMSLLVAGAICLSFIFDNTVESKTIMPNIVAKNIITDYLEEKRAAAGDDLAEAEGETEARVYFDIIAQVSLWGSGAPCGIDTWDSCPQDIRIDTGLVCNRAQRESKEPIPVALRPRKCQFRNGVCMVRFWDKDCDFDDKPKHEIMFSMVNTEAVATRIEVVLKMSSSIPCAGCVDDSPNVEFASLTRRFRPDIGKVFKGFQPSEVDVICVPSVYTVGSNPDYKDLKTGMHAEFMSSAKGAEIDASHLTYAQGVYIKLGLNLGLNSLVTMRSDEKTVEEVAGESGGALQVIFVVIGGLLIGLDIALRQYIEAHAKENRRVYCKVSMESTNLSLQVPAYFVRVSIGTPRQFRLEELDEDLIKFSSDIAARPNEDDLTTELSKQEFSIQLREQDLDCNLAADFDTLEQINVHVRVEICDSAKNRVIANAECEFPGYAPGETEGKKVTLPLVPPKRLKKALAFVSTLIMKPKTDSTLLENKIGDISLVLLRQVSDSDETKGKTGKNNKNKLSIPNECHLFQNNAETSVAVFQIGNKLDKLRAQFVALSLNEQQSLDELDGRLGYLESNLQGMVRSRSQSMMGKSDTGDEIKKLLERQQTLEDEISIRPSTHEIKTMIGLSKYRKSKSYQSVDEIFQQTLSVREEGEQQQEEEEQQQEVKEEDRTQVKEEDDTSLRDIGTNGLHASIEDAGHNRSEDNNRHNKV